jgi:hypothetical protein
MIVPGRVLVIDDVPEQVNEVVDFLRHKGESVTFTTSMPDDAVLKNVRLLIIDLYLVGNDKEASYEAVASILEKISEKTEFFIIAIWTKFAGTPAENQQIIKELKEIFNERTNTDLKAIFLEPFGKLSITQMELVGRLENTIASNPICGLLLEIERSVENARDRAVSDLVATASVSAILKTLKEEIGDVALSRQMVGLFLKVLSRHCKSTETMSDCIENLLTESPSIDVNKYGDIHNLQSYCNVSVEELSWTGDVLERKDGKDEYGVIVSPACDFAQRKKRPLDYMKIIPAVRINHSDLFACGDNPELLNRINAKLKAKFSSEECTRAVLTGRSIKKRLFILRYLKDYQEDTFFHLVLDFQGVFNIHFKETGMLLKEEGWRRVCRVDTPIIDDLLQQYAAYSSRIGIPSIPRDIVEGIIGKIKKS